MSYSSIQVSKLRVYQVFVTPFGATLDFTDIHIGRGGYSMEFVPQFFLLFVLSPELFDDFGIAQNPVFHLQKFFAYFVVIHHYLGTLSHAFR